MPQITLIINRSWGELDWILPVVVHLHDNGYRIRVVFWNQAIYELSSLNKDLWRQLESIATEVFTPRLLVNQLTFKERVKRVFKGGLASLAPGLLLRFLFVPQSIPSDVLDRLPVKELLMNEKAVTKSILFIDKSFAREVDKNKLKQAYLEATFQDHLVIFPHGAMIQWDLRPDDLWVRNWVMKDTNIGRKTVFLADTDQCAALYANVWTLKSIACGTPRYQDWWRFRQSDVTHASERKRILIISGFFSGLDQVSHLQDIFTAIMDMDVEIIVRLHPRESVEQFKTKLDNASVGQIPISYADTSVLDISQQVDLVISLPSTACLDSVSARKPVIEYCDYESILDRRIQFKRDGERLTFFSKTGVVASASNAVELKRMVHRLIEEPSEAEALASAQYSVFMSHTLHQHHAGEIVQNFLETDL